MFISYRPVRSDLLLVITSDTLCRFRNSGTLSGRNPRLESFQRIALKNEFADRASGVLIKALRELEKCLITPRSHLGDDIAHTADQIWIQRFHWRRQRTHSRLEIIVALRETLHL